MSERLTRQQLACAGEGYDPVASWSAAIGSARCIDGVLQPENIGLVESVKRGMR